MGSLEGHSLLNRYFLREHIGTGGMAEVYLAWDNMRSTKMAVKVLKRDLIRNPRFRRMFEKEAEVLRKLEHPNIVRLYEFQCEEDIAFIVMDWVDGTDLRKEISDRGKPFDLENTALVLQPVCAALYYAHQNQVYHCDVKPANILRSTQGQVRLTDFGVARFAAKDSGGGTPYYMAPEQFVGNAVDGRTDIYALGITLYEMVTGGQYPFRGDSPHSVGTTSKERIGWEHLNQPVPPLRQLNSDLPPEVENVILTALSKQPEERFATPMDLREAFEHARMSKGQRGGSQKTTAGSTILSRPQRIEKLAARPQTPARLPRGPYLFGTSGEMAGQAIVIPRGDLTIGRGSRNQMRLTEGSVSRQHAIIQRTRRGVYISDQGSSLGTYVNGRRIMGPTALKHGDVVQIGYEQEFEYREQ